jgi:rare lipoprotein A
VRVNDRGPFVDGRLIELSKAAARQLGFDRQGVTRVRVRYISAAPPLPASGLMLAAYRRPSSATTQPPSVDGFDGIEQADAGGHIRPASASDAAPIPAEGDEGPPPTSRSGSPIRSSALPAASAAAVGPYAVQAGAFGSRYAADRAVTRLSATGSAQVTPIQRKGGILYRVTVGGFSDASAAAAAKLKVIAQGFTDAKVVQAE